jgi:molybdopterin-guanine dinucleotide biosynthesis protein A
VLGGLLVGGESRRMGRPKQLLRFRGKALSEVAAAALAPHVRQVVIIGRGEVPPALATTPRLDDAAGLRGPLAGMLAAMRWAPGAAWVFASCDLPLACPEAVEWLLTQRRPDRWAVLPRVSDRFIEPLFALYEPQAGLLLEAVAASGLAAPSLIASDRAVVSPTPPPHLAPAWRSVNTPEELAAVSEEGWPWPGSGGEGA